MGEVDVVRVVEIITIILMTIMMVIIINKWTRLSLVDLASVSQIIPKQNHYFL